MTYEQLYNKREKQVQRYILNVYLKPIYKQLQTNVLSLGVSAAYVSLQNLANEQHLRDVLEHVYYSESKRFYYWQEKEFKKYAGQKNWFAQIFDKLWEALIGDSARSLELFTRIKDINKTTIKDLRRIMEYARMMNLTSKQTASLIAKEGLFIRSRALRIARTELTYSASLGTEQAAKQSSLPLQKVWIAARDERTRESHRAVDNKKVGKDEKFLVGGKLMKYPGDPAGGVAEVVNCRCSVSYVVDESKVLI